MEKAGIVYKNDTEEEFSPCGHCATCRWWDVTEWATVGSAQDVRGACKKFSPMRGGYIFSLYACDWCGDYEYFLQPFPKFTEKKP